jgi:hypothetical protein
MTGNRQARLNVRAKFSLGNQFHMAKAWNCSTLSKPRRLLRFCLILMVAVFCRRPEARIAMVIATITGTFSQATDA